MGAEGSIQIVKREDWDKAGLRDPIEYGYYTGKMLGIEAVWTYFGEPEYETLPARIAYDEATRALDMEALEVWDWFDSHAETHKVWT